MRTAIAIALGAAALMQAPARAETLAEAWSAALQSDHALAAARLESEAGRFEAQAARGLRLPTLTASGGYLQMQDAPAFDFSAAGLPVQLPEVIDDDNAVLGGVSVTLPLYTGGRITAAVAAADEGRRALDAREAQAVQDLKLAVVQAYVDVLRARRTLAVADSRVASLDSYVGEVRSLFEREVAPRNDLLAAQVALASANHDRIRAHNAAVAAQAAYNRRLGRPLSNEAALDPALPALPVAFEAAPLEQLIERALDARVELDALEAQANAAGHQARGERARVLPQLALTGGYTYLENQAFDREEFASAFIGLEWPLFDGGVARSRSAALRRTQRALEERRSEAASQLALEVRRVWLDAAETRSRVAATQEAVAQSEENLRITRQQYQAGLVTSTRVLEAESLRAASRGNHDNAVLDAQLASYRLARAVGAL